MSDSVTVRVPAKINLVLAVGPLRQDGFHELVTVYQALSLADEVTIRSADRPEMRVFGEGARSIPVDGDNLAWRAAAALARHQGWRGREHELHIVLRKRIPVAGGMAGGSADAAGTLLALAELWETGLDRATLSKIAADLGSDVPFTLHGGTAIGTGRGERLLAIDAPARFHWAIALSDGGLATPAVYSRLDDLRAAGATPSARSHQEVLDALHSGSPAALASVLRNDLQIAALSLRPELQATLDSGLRAGALAGIVSGSGPTCVFLCQDQPQANEVASRLRRSGACRDTLVAHGPVPGATALPTTSSLLREVAR
ncbi:4-(cytidine 5'-diphospho)-2-C-methyl-D-erythritol kinase [Amycolatopsis sp. cg5]|uniref:4-(cytidine 5'-diphospho)-2-C-methyl-D-erythritol kinase n=1 Tax=Amycolatopsis sp. cg5 TaxID=3238802 RepID=UPI003524BF3C